MAALTGSVEDVSVMEGRLFRGEPVTIVGGRIETARLLESLASELSAAPRACRAASCSHSTRSRGTSAT
jgi:hypothetical protein